MEKPYAEESIENNIVKKLGCKEKILDTRGGI